MVEFRWIQMSLFLILKLHVTVTGQSFTATVRDGDDVTLPCENVISDQNECDNTTWIFTGSGKSAAVTLIDHGQIYKEAKSKSDRLSVTENCSLVIKKVTAEDVGRYTCRQFMSGQQQGGESVFDLSVVTITGQYFYFTVRDGDDVTLPCGNVTDDQNECDSTTWIFTGSGNSAAVTLFKKRQINKDLVKSKSDRLRVTENCSLVIKKVTDEDVGFYTCRQFISGRQLGGDSEVDLYVVTKSSSSSETEHQNNVTLTCSVSTYDQCKLTVKWLNEDNNNHLTDMKTSQSSCSATVTFTTSDFNQYSDLLKCEVTDGNRRKQQFPFRRQTSGEKPAKETTKPSSTTTTTSTLQPPPPTTTTTTSTTTTRPVTEETNEKTSTSSSEPTKSPGGTNITDPGKQQGWSWWFIIGAVGLAALLIIVVATFIRWKKTKGNRTQRTENKTDPEDGVPYASISFTKMTKNKTWDQQADEVDAVTYSTVRASSSAAGASTDPSILYTTVNKPNK
ncbi:uncharacterized protein LOC113149060 [Anabas testudineus]|uniref:uncharacterized protein LOC113149060 n=1 Tax=Anabas testudineus TaxID=64144 RepID=UPI00143DFC4F|nr:uncharacterized protein LOC113149060 [Anabas testudineus]